MLKQEDFINSVADILRQSRRERKYTLDKLAEKSDTDYSTVSLIENGRQNPRVYTFYKLLYALDIDLLSLINIKKDEIAEERISVFNRLDKFDTKTLENICDLLDQFVISKKVP